MPFLVVLIVFLVGVIIALYTRRGSAIDHHPYRHVYAGAPGSTLPCDDFSGSDRTSATELEVIALWSRAPDNSAQRRAEAAARSRRERSAPRPKSDAMPIRSPVRPLR